MIIAKASSLAEAVSICVSQSQGGWFRYVYRRPDGSFEVHSMPPPADPGYVLVASAHDGVLDGGPT